MNSQPILTDTYWPALKAKIRAQPNALSGVQYKLECSICLEDMEMLSEGESSKTGCHQGETTSHRALICYCGHLFGESCLIGLFNYKLEDGKIECPNCRSSFKYNSCRHNVFARTFSDRAEALAAMPKTQGEGGRLPPRCAECLVKEMLKNLADNMAGHARETPLDDGKVIGFSVEGWRGADRHFIAGGLDPLKKGLVCLGPAPRGRMMEQLLQNSYENLLEEYRDAWVPRDMFSLNFRMCLYGKSTE